MAARGLDSDRAVEMVNRIWHTKANTDRQPMWVLLNIHHPERTRMESRRLRAVALIKIQDWGTSKGST